MKYKKIFSSWWFWALIVVYFLFRISFGTGFNFGFSVEFIALYLGIFLGSFIGVLFFVSLFWLIGKGFKAIYKKR